MAYWEKKLMEMEGFKKCTEGSEEKEKEMGRKIERFSRKNPGEPSVGKIFIY
jgi:hypothetical protein